jgi:hypothetical protein
VAKFLHSSVLDGGTDLIRTRAGTNARVKLHLIKAYAAGDSYATVIGNSCGSFDMAPGDYVQSGGSAAPRVTTIGAKAVPLTANSGAAPNLHAAHVDSVSSEVLYVTDETTDQVVTSGGVFNVPAHTISFGQPT